MINIDLEKGRNTGRTTRMLFAAAQHATHNGQTFILMHSAGEVAGAYRYLKSVFQPHILEKLVIRSATASDCVWLDLGTPDMRGLKGELFVDHHVYAERLQGINKLLEGFHKYDTEHTE